MDTHNIDLPTTYIHTHILLTNIIPRHTEPFIQIPENSEIRLFLKIYMWYSRGILYLYGYFKNLFKID